MKQKYRKFISLAVCASLTGCAMVQSRFTRELDIDTIPKVDANQVVYLEKKPQRSAIKIGTISTSGNGYADFDDLIEEARQEAADLGADFIVAEDSGLEKQLVYSPGYSSYKESSSVGYNNYFGGGSSNATGYSVGPSVNTVRRPWGVFSVWVYLPSQIGIRFDDNWNIVGFHLHSNAPSLGIQIGDRLVGINNCDVFDEKLVPLMMEVRPGDEVKVTVDRKTQRLEAYVTALSN